MRRRLELYSNMASISTVAQIFNIIVHADEGITRAELARLTGFSKSTISQHIDTLLSTGFIVEVLNEDSYSRRNTHHLKLNQDCGLVISIDLGVTSLNVGICNISGEPLIVEGIENFNINLGPKAVLSIAIEIANRLISKLEISDKRILGVGMGVPAPLEFSTGRPICPPITQSWDKFPVKDYLEREFGVRSYVDNDVNIMAIAEHWKGDARNDQDFLFIKLGTGIGCGIFSNGVIYRGTNGCAGDIGHIKVDGCTETCYCGNTGCLEKLAGAPAIKEQANNMAKNSESSYLAQLFEKDEEITCHSVSSAISAGDIGCIEYVHTLGNYIGDVVAKLINFYNPSKVIFGGGISNFGDILLNPIKGMVFGCSNSLATRNLKIIRSGLGDSIGVIGAAILVRDELFKPKEFTKTLNSFSESSYS